MSNSRVRRQRLRRRRRSAKSSGFLERWLFEMYKDSNKLMELMKRL